jgi:hypothetical protein
MKSEKVWKNGKMKREMKHDDGKREMMMGTRNDDGKRRCKEEKK